MSLEYAGLAWACIDCYYVLNGFDPELSHDQAQDLIERIATRHAGYKLFCGMRAEEHNCPRANGIFAEEECFCEHVVFSWESCDICGSTLGGSREAVSMFLDKEGV